jgi:hypothetical protein
MIHTIVELDPTGSHQLETRGEVSKLALCKLMKDFKLSLEEITASRDLLRKRVAELQLTDADSHLSANRCVLHRCDTLLSSICVFKMRLDCSVRRCGVGVNMVILIRHKPQTQN